MSNVNAFLNVLEEVIMDGATTNERKILDLSAKYLSLEMDLEAEEDEVYKEYIRDTMAEIDMQIERLKAVCWSSFLEVRKTINILVNERRKFNN